MNWSSLLDNTVTAVAGLARSNVVKGMMLQAARDIYISRTDREKGFNEYKYANEGDDLEVIGQDADNPGGGCRVINRDNFDQIETVPFVDIEDTFGDYGK